MIEVTYSFGILFVTCELGQRFNLEFAECGDMFERFDWYLFPAHAQRMLPIILCHSQQTVDLKCFGSVAANRQTFKNVSTLKQLSF